MKLYSRLRIQGLKDDFCGADFSDFEFDRCSFISCSLSPSDDATKRSLVRNVVMTNCSVRRCFIGGPICEEILIDGLQTHGLLQTWGAAFQHVTLKGNIDRLMLTSLAIPLHPDSAEQAAFDKANVEYYSRVDWALDISNVRAMELDIRGVPGRLIRRDPETQILVTREKALLGEWRKLPFEEPYCNAAFNQFLRDRHETLVIVAATRHPKFPAYLRDLNLLRSAEIAEHD